MIYTLLKLISNWPIEWKVLMVVKLLDHWLTDMWLYWWQWGNISGYNSQPVAKTTIHHRHRDQDWDHTAIQPTLDIRYTTIISNSLLTENISFGRNVILKIRIRNESSKIEIGSGCSSAMEGYNLQFYDCHYPSMKLLAEIFACDGLCNSPFNKMKNQWVSFLIYLENFSLRFIDWLNVCCCKKCCENILN